MICYIFFEISGRDFTGPIQAWSIDAHETKENRDTLEAHLARWIPDATFLGYHIGSMEGMLPDEVTNSARAFPTIEPDVWEKIKDRVQL